MERLPGAIFVSTRAVKRSPCMKPASWAYPLVAVVDTNSDPTTSIT